jgi:phosphoribosylformylglycinamidine cyclo-ligase
VLVEGHEDELELERVDLGGSKLADVLIEPTRIYAGAVKALEEADIRPKAMAHITGGGITENLDRVLPDDCDARVHPDSWRQPAVFSAIAQAASLGPDDMLKTFNMGVGFCLVFPETRAPDAAAILRGVGETVYEIGEIVEGKGEVVYG